VVPLLGLERRGSKLYEPGAVAVVDESEAVELESALELSGYEPVEVERALADVLEARGRAVVVGDGSAIGRAAYAARATCSSPSAKQRARSRSRGSATCSAARAVLRSFCSSGSTPTG
jgi:hypothetical protein